MNLFRKMLASPPKHVIERRAKAVPCYRCGLTPMSVDPFPNMRASIYCYGIKCDNETVSIAYSLNDAIDGWNQVNERMRAEQEEQPKPQEFWICRGTAFTSLGFALCIQSGHGGADPVIHVREVV